MCSREELKIQFLMHSLERERERQDRDRDTERQKPTEAKTDKICENA